MNTGTIVAQTIIDTVTGALLNDRAKVRFTQADQLAFLNEALLFITGAVPTASTDIISFTCVAGARQSTPNSAHSFIGANYNLASDGTTPGRIITPVKRENVDVPNPYWRAASPKSEIRHVVSDDDTPSIFDVYPPAIAGTKIAITVAVILTPIAATDPIPINDTYEPAIINYMLFRSYQKNTTFANNAQVAQQYMQAVMSNLQTLGVSDEATREPSQTKQASSTT